MERAGPALTFRPLVSAPLVIACPADHRLAGARDLDPQDLVGESIIELPDGWRSRELFDEWFAGAGLQRHIRLEIDDWFGVLTMVQRGMGLSYGPPECIDADIFRGVAVATLAEAPVWELGVVTRDDALRGAASRAFLAAYLEQGANAPDRWSW